MRLSCPAQAREPEQPAPRTAPSRPARPGLACQHRVLKVLDVEGLQAISAFNKQYLHLDRAPSEVARPFDRLEHDEDRRRAAGR